MSPIVTITGSPSASSRTLALTEHVGGVLRGQGFTVDAVNVRELPAQDLLSARGDSPELRDALGLVERARGVVVTTPVYKAAYSGVLKTFLDLLPQSGLAGKIVLPLVTGGTVSHVLAIDYALRPVLHALGADHVVGGLFILDKLLERKPSGGLVISPDISQRLDNVLADFVASVRRRHLAI